MSDEIKSQDIIDFARMVEKQKEKQDTCKHIYGVDEGVIGCMVNAKNTECEYEFTYCPKCGKKLMEA